MGEKSQVSLPEEFQVIYANTPPLQDVKLVSALPEDTPVKWSRLSDLFPKNRTGKKKKITLYWINLAAGR